MNEPIKIRQLEAILAAQGWTYAARIGLSHRHWRHPDGSVITLSGDPSHVCDPAQLAAVQERRQGHVPATRPGAPFPTYLALITQTPSGAAGLIPDLTVLANTPATDLASTLEQAVALHLMTSGAPVPRPVYMGFQDLPPPVRAAYDDRDVEVQFVTPAPLNPVSLQVARAIDHSRLSYREVARRAGLGDADLARLANPFYTGHSVADLQRLATTLHLTVNVTFEEPVILPPHSVVSTTWQGDTSLLLELRDVPEVVAAALPLTVQSETGVFSLIERQDTPAGPGRTTYAARLLNGHR
ncbi:hypothetical protein [Deinococcus radiotolerans]|uniref:HTH cro/C1-type domain-containing protein n=1 Tax=Deinococcus radiotolerans TaxID=1309407 RepID=A0ABQ2FPE7_9DEIO|nr:hypothetical protein [Deinococcus radiotolerans]GGL13933.1 hypothetical protein GCM10010844_36000 [Deinococcus radiotolerans]